VYVWVQGAVEGLRAERASVRVLRLLCAGFESSCKLELSASAILQTIRYLTGGSKEDGSRLFSANGHKLKYRNFHLNIKIFCCESGETLEQIAQRSCKVSIPCIRNLTREGSETICCS